MTSTSRSDDQRDRQLLLFTRTAGFRHDSIPSAIEALTARLSPSFRVTATEDPAAFDSLSRFTVVAFVHTTGDVLSDAQMDELERFVRGGGGWVGVHAASDTEFDSPFYGELLGGDAWFDRHPAIQDAEVTIEDAQHASTSHYAHTTFTRTDEWYDFRANPRDAVRVLATVDESTYDDGGMGDDHPIAWCHTVGSGRSWYTAMGHTKESWGEPDFLAHVVGGVAYAAGAGPPCQ